MGCWTLVLNINTMFSGSVFSHRTKITLIHAPEPWYSNAEPWGPTARRLDKELSPFIILSSSSSSSSNTSSMVVVWW
jgi:hypothetical protein